MVISFPGKSVIVNGKTFCVEQRRFHCLLPLSIWHLVALQYGLKLSSRMRIQQHCLVYNSHPFFFVPVYYASFFVCSSELLYISTASLQKAHDTTVNLQHEIKVTFPCHTSNELICSNGRCRHPAQAAA